MDSNDAAALLDAHPEAIAVHDHPAGPVLILDLTSAALRATPARVHKPFRLRVCLSYDGPPWLSLLAQCAWLRGGIIGASPAGDTWVGTERTPERLLRQ